MSLTPELITIQRASYAKDLAGGDIITWTTVDTGMATRNFYRSQGTDEHRTEQGAHNSAGPAIVNETRQFLCFEAAVPNIRDKDQVIVGDGTTWLVLYVRNYTDATAINVQVDIEWIQ